jgi:hypothetical protein
VPVGARWVIGFVLAVIGVAALFWASRQDFRGQCIGVAVTGLCYLGIMLQIKWAWDAREARNRARQPVEPAENQRATRPDEIQYGLSGSA